MFAIKYNEVAMGPAEGTPEWTALQKKLCHHKRVKTEALLRIPTPIRRNSKARCKTLIERRLRGIVEAAPGTFKDFILTDHPDPIRLAIELRLYSQFRVSERENCYQKIVEAEEFI